MCGIAGLWNLKASTGNEESKVKIMTDALFHRGPDSSGIWCSDDNALVLGHRRLAIQDISPLGHQPMHSSSERFVIIFNGEIYNFKELMTKLKPFNIKFKGHSDTEVMLACFDIWGIEETIGFLEGMFAVAVYDKEQEELWLIRDRMGEKPLYVFLDETGLLFASELKALREVLPKQYKLDMDALNRYFRYGYFSPKDTPFHVVKKLAPGHWLSFTKEQLIKYSDTQALTSESNEYWINSKTVDLNTRNSAFTDQYAAQAVDEFEQLLTDSVKKQSIADVELGVFLSGGIDSSLVASVLQNASSSSIKTYTIAFDDKRYNEADYARRIAEHLGTQHTEIELSMEECFETIKLLPELLDEPFADASLLPTYLVTHAARKHVTVCLSGDGGDELFAGYNRYISGNKFASINEKLPRVFANNLSKLIQFFSIKSYDQAYHLIALLKRFSGKVPEKDIGIKLHKIGRLLAQDDPGDIYVDLLSYWRKSPLKGVDQIDAGYFQTVSDYPIEEDFINNAMLHDQRFYLCCDNLFKVDRAAMLNSLEVRLPLLTHPIVEYANRLPLEYKVREGQSKWIMRELLYRWVPKKLIDRPKMGFSIPLNSWLRKELKSWASEYIYDNDLLHTANLDHKKIQQAWNEHQHLVSDHALAIWTIITYLIWFQTNQKKIDIVNYC